MGQMTVSNH